MTCDAIFGAVRRCHLENFPHLLLGFCAFAFFSVNKSKHSTQLIYFDFFYFVTTRCLLIFLLTATLIFNWIHDIWSKTISSKRRLVECDIWSIRRFADYDVAPTTTIGRKFVELRRNYVEIWSKTDLYGKNKNCLHLRFSHLQYIFTPVPGEY